MKILFFTWRLQWEWRCFHFPRFRFSSFILQPLRGLWRSSNTLEFPLPRVARFPPAPPSAGTLPTPRMSSTSATIPTSIRSASGRLTRRCSKAQRERASGKYWAEGKRLKKKRKRTKMPFLEGGEKSECLKRRRNRDAAARRTCRRVERGRAALFPFFFLINRFWRYG